MFGKLRWSRCGKDDASRRLYKAQLCASCHAMREFSGRPTSLLANYDQSLLVLVLSSLLGAPLQTRRCTAVPWRTVAVQDLDPPLRRFVAAGNLALLDAKLRDDIDDGGRWYARPVRWLLRTRTRRAECTLRELGFAAELVAQLPARQSAVERLAEPSLAALAEPSATLLGEVFAHGGHLAGAVGREHELRRLGRAIAGAVYALDALDDHADDLRGGRFNAVAATSSRHGFAASVTATRTFVDAAAIEARQVAASLLPPDRAAIVGDILLQLTRRAARAADALLGAPVRALRPAEAGDCDCPCDGCDCGPCDSPTCTCCDPCCDALCWSRRERRKREAGK